MTAARRRSRLAAALAPLAAAALAAGLAAQEPGAHDEARAAWQYRRPVTLPARADGDGRFTAIPIPPDVAEHSQPGLPDLRLVGADGHDVAFVLDVDVPRATERRRAGRLVEAQHERRLTSAWIVDFGTRAPFDRLELDVDGADFSKRVAIDTSDDGARWTEVPGVAWIFDRPWRGRQLHDTVLERPAPIVARYVRIAIDDVRSRPVVVRGATAVLTGNLGGSRWTREAALVKLDTPAGSPSRYRVDAPAGLPVERITIAADDAAFWRRVHVREEGSGGALETLSGASAIYRVRLDDADLDADQRDVDLTRPARGALVIEVEDGDSPPLTRPRVTLSGLARRALVPPGATGLTLYYGNPATRRPVYDLEALRTRLAHVADFLPAALGPEAVNPHFAPPAPLAFLATRGAAIDTAGWASARTLRIEGGDDIYTLTLDPGDLGHLREDLADLRVVDDDGRQVPYVIEARDEAARVPLEQAPAAPRANAAKTSAFELRIRGAGEGAAAPPLSAIELTFAEAFYTRPAVVTVADPRAPHGRRVIAQETLRALRRDPGVAAAPQSLSLGDLRIDRVVVEIGDGDNAALTLSKAEAVVLVPRVTFKAKGGTYHLLMGNREAGPPTYDLAALRQDLLAWSATPLDRRALSPLTANTGYRRGPGDVVQGLAKGPWMWAALGLSIVALLWLTRTILKAPPPPPPAPPPPTPPVS
jgi:hypothetical protein